MPSPTFILLYVADNAVSVPFYTTLLGRPPVESAPTFAMFALDGGMMLGLWRKDGVAPPANPPGGHELAFTTPDLDATHTTWQAQGIQILQPPTDMDFGRTFLALDPDGHRLRVLTPPA
jgi:predicted enzyme related to lactoylglutathione lyase